MLLVDRLPGEVIITGHRCVGFEQTTDEAELILGAKIPYVPYLVAQWRRENPSKKPNPGHILQILNKAWGERNADQVRAALSTPERREGMTPEEHAAVSAELAERFPGLIKRVPGVSA